MGQLQVQAHLRAFAFALYKVWGERHPADLCTKHLARPVMDRLLALTGAIREHGSRDCTSGNRKGWAHTLPRLTAVGLPDF